MSDTEILAHLFVDLWWLWATFAGVPTIAWLAERNEKVKSQRKR